MSDCVVTFGKDMRIKDADARGNLVPDAWYAALAVESGCEWVTLDRDYAPFPELKMASAV